MNKGESLALYAQGRDAWNAWAEKMLAERAKLKETGPKAEAALANWTEAAKADFSEHVFESDAEFSGFVFLGNADFRRASFFGNAWFSEASFSGDARFEGASFSGDAWFREASFSGYAGFDKASFSGDAGFEGASFSGDAWFGEASFSGNAFFREASFSGNAGFREASFSGTAWFREASFSGNARFDKALFSGNAWFNETAFSGDTEFNEVTFSGHAWFKETKLSSHARFHKAVFLGEAIFEEAVFSDDARFDQVLFGSFSSFQSASFEKDAYFVGMKGESIFTLQDATFNQVPNFVMAHFAEAPRLDDIDILPPKRRFRWQKPKPDRTAHWRALKRLAVQGHDHERELMFFAEELKAARGIHDKAFPNLRNLFRKDKPIWLGGVRYWTGIFYQALSNFGRSMILPLGWWFASIFGFALYYLSQHFTARNPAYATNVFDWFWRSFLGWLGLAQEIPALSCLAGPGTPWDAATYLSVIKGSIVFGRFDTEKLKQTYACLFGDGLFPDAVAYWGLGQSVFSAALVFLFLLAVRNHFRIK